MNCRPFVKASCVALVVSLSALLPLPAAGQGMMGHDSGLVPHPPVVKMAAPDAPNQEISVLEMDYLPGGVTPAHLHPAAVTFYVLTGSGIFQEKGKEPVTLKAGESLFVPAGTVHSHWNASKTEPFRVLEFIVAEKGKGGAVSLPSN